MRFLTAWFLQGSQGVRGARERPGTRSSAAAQLGPACGPRRKVHRRAAEWEGAAQWGVWGAHGKRCLYGSFVPCSGEVSLSFSQVSIASRSYVLPTAAMTGSIISSNMSAQEC